MTDTFLTITPLGGLGEIGMNCQMWNTPEGCVLVDCGIMFPDDQQLGVDVVIPPLEPILAQRGRLLGVVLTHGHEDHIGACLLYTSITYFPLLADLLYKASPSHIGAVFTVASLGTAAIAMNLAWLGRKYSHRRLMLSATCCYVVAQTLMLVLPDAVSSLW